MMSEENNTEMFATERRNTADDTKKLSEDARGLGPMQTGRFAIGLVDEIVGDGGVEVPGFVATKNELVQLVQYWATEIVDLDFEYFLYGCTGSSEWRTHQFANRRLNAISKVIGEKEVREAFRQAEQAFGKGVDQRTWKIFMEGTKEEQERFQQEVQQNLADKAVSGPGLPAARPITIVDSELEDGL
jgi:hypothetical protein